MNRTKIKREPLARGEKVMPWKLPLCSRQLGTDIINMECFPWLYMVCILCWVFKGTQGPTKYPAPGLGEAKCLSLRKTYDSVKRVSAKRGLCADSSPLGLCTKDNLRLPIAYPLNLETWAEGDIFMLIEMLTGRKSKLQTIYLSI